MKLYRISQPEENVSYDTFDNHKEYIEKKNKTRHLMESL